MQRFLRAVVWLAVNGGSGSSVDCKHGAWNASTRTCDCERGWTTDWINQDILGGVIVYCNSQASTPAPGNTTAAVAKSSSSTSTILVIVIVVAAVVVVALGILCYCYRRRSKNTKLKKQRKQAVEEEKHLRYLAELKRQQQEDEAKWNCEALVQRQMWDSRMQRHLRNDAAKGELWSGSFTAATTNSQFVSYPAPLSSPLATPRRSREFNEFPAFTDPHSMRLERKCPNVRYLTAPSEPSSNLYDCSSSACTTTSDECIYTQYSESPPPALPNAVVASGASPFTTPRCAELHNGNRPF